MSGFFFLFYKYYYQRFLLKISSVKICSDYERQAKICPIYCVHKFYKLKDGVSEWLLNFLMG